MEEELVRQIIRQNAVTLKVREKYFKEKDFKFIRDWLEKHNIDRHLSIDVKSAGILLLISNSNENNKVLVQVRSSEKNRLGIFGGGIEGNETPIECAIRELREETGMEVDESQLEFLEINEHNLEYKNGDKVHYIAHIYILRLNEYPFIKLDNESNGMISISKENYKYFIDVKDTNLLQLHKCWWKTVLTVLEI